MSRDVTIACYYFPNYHPTDLRNNRIKGHGWSEWELVRQAKPRFPGHQQPNIPLWGYTDESNPDAMAQKLEAAAVHGIDAFIFDWYWYDDGPFLDRALDQGFLGATNNRRVKFALMWANHNWLDIHPARHGQPQPVLFPGPVTPSTFRQLTDLVIERYFKHPSYWCPDGRPYFSFYEINTLMKSFGSLKATRAALDDFRDRARQAGLPGIHMNAIVWERPILPGEQIPAQLHDVVRLLGFDSVTSYVWIHHVALPRMQTDYVEVQNRYFEFWDSADKTFTVPYYPNVTMGWDSSPRACQDDPFDDAGYPFMHTLSGNTPERFRQALQITRDRLLARSRDQRIITINCWNEWTEGSYLEPDTRHGMAYLEAVRDVVT